MTNTNKRYRATQYQSLSPLGDTFAKAFFGRSAGTEAREKVGDKYFRWLWTAKLWKFFHHGESAGLGLRYFTVEITDTHRIPAGDGDGFVDWA